MKCPSPIAEILIEMLRIALLRIRASGDAVMSAVEADHVHNLPDLLREYSPEKLDFYWSVERPCFLDKAGDDAQPSFDESWCRLAPYVPAEATSSV
jgi:hypothetical protein